MNKHFISTLPASCALRCQPNLKTCTVSWRGGLLGGGGYLCMYVSYVGMCNSFPQLQLWEHLGSFSYFLFFKDSQCRTQASHTIVYS